MILRDPPIEGAAADGDRPSIHGAMLGKALAVIAELGRRDAPMPIPDTCLTCAFREGSMPNQTAGTGVMALNCVLRIDTDRFACHHGMKEGQPKQICAGYVAAMIAPFSLVREVLDAFNAEMETIKDGQPDDIRIAFDAWLAGVDPGRRMDVYEAARAYAKSKRTEIESLG